MNFFFLIFKNKKLKWTKNKKKMIIWPIFFKIFQKSAQLLNLVSKQYFLDFFAKQYDQVVCERYGVGLWKTIMKEWIYLSGRLAYQVGNGQRVRFWMDKWCGDEPLCFLFFHRKRQRDILIEKRSTREGWWILPPKKTNLQEYKNKKIHSKNIQTL